MFFEASMDSSGSQFIPAVNTNSHRHHCLEYDNISLTPCETCKREIRFIRW